METISRSCKELMIRSPFYGFFLMGLNKNFSTSLPTAGVSQKGLGFQLDINKEFWYDLSKEHRLGVLLHELLHLAFFHLFMRESFSDYKLFNIAADLEVNQYIKDEWIPSGALLLNTFPDLNLPIKAGTKKYYELLQQNLDSDSPDPTLQGAYDSAGDMHIDWDAVDEELAQDVFKDSKIEVMKSQIERQLKDSADSVQRGLIPGELASLIDKLFVIKAQVFDWKTYFRRFLGVSFNIYTKKSYKAPSSRFEDSPGLKIKKKHHILVAIDTSGSVSDYELTEFFSEINHIYKTGCSIDIIECDTRINRIYPFKGKWDGSVHGRGGTIFSPVIEYYNKTRGKYTTLIYFTDGYGEYDIVKPYNRTMWVVTSSGKKDKDYYPGYMIQIPKNN